LARFASALARDRWAAYAGFDCLRAICNAGHLRELTAIPETIRSEPEGTEAMIELLAEGNALASEPRAASFAALPGRFVHDIQTSYDRCNLLTIGVNAMSSLATYSARLPYWVLAGALLGAVAGVLFGDHALFRPIGTAYVNLMEVVVFPYIICSLLHGLAACRRIPRGCCSAEAGRSWSLSGPSRSWSSS
jgi:hypothetical protein